MLPSVSCIPEDIKSKSEVAAMRVEKQILRYAQDDNSFYLTATVMVL
jgi:hypothetical protein